MSRWPIKPLLQAAELRTTRVSAFPGTRRYVSTGAVDETVVIDSEPVTFDDRPSRADLVATQGDVLFARMQGTNKVIVVNKDTESHVWSTGFAALRPQPATTSASWLGYWLRSSFFKERKDALCTGATQRAITNDGIRELEIPVPPLSDQERIVKILDDAEAVRRLRNEASHRLASAAQALFGALLGTSRSDWGLSRLEALCSKIEDCPHSTPIYAEGKTPFPCVRSSDIQDGRFDWSTTRHVNESQYKERVRRLVPQFGDVVYCREGARLGNAAIVPTDITMCLGQRMMLFRADAAVAVPELIWALLHSGIVQQQVEMLVGGAASPHINICDIRAFLVPVPPLRLQHAFASQVAKIRELETGQDVSRQRIDDLFQSLLHRAFRGEL